MTVINSSVGPIAPAEVDRSYLLARLAAPDLDRETWRDLCATAATEGVRSAPLTLPAGAGEGRQIWVARDPKGYLRALCVFRPVSRAFSGLTLDVEMLVIASMVDPKGAVHEMVAALQMLGRQWDCSSVRITTASDDRQLRRYLLPYSDAADHILSVPIPSLAS